MLKTDQKPFTENQIIEPEKTELENNFNLLDELRQETDKDAEGGVPELDAEDLLTEQLSFEEKTASSETVKNPALIAKVIISAVNIAFGFLLQFVAANWSEEGDKKYSLSESKQKQLAEPLTLLIEQQLQQGKKFNPVWVLIFLSVVLYIPLFMKALKEKNEKQTEKRKKLFFNAPTGGEIGAKNGKVIPMTIETVLPVYESPKEPEKKKEEVTDFVKKLKEITKKKGRRTKEDSDFLDKYGMTDILSK
jgi:hypothetical protein